MNEQQDVTDYVEAKDGCSSLAFEDEKWQARFELGVSMMVYKWDALDVAVENNWGGPESAAKRDWITSIVVELFRNRIFVDATLIEEVLLYAMADEFETNVEDDSAQSIAAGILGVYRQCNVKNYTEIERLYTAWQQRVKGAEGSRPVNVVEDPFNPNISESEYESEEDKYLTMEIKSRLCEDQVSSERIEDDDGFKLVQAKGRRNH